MQDNMNEALHPNNATEQTPPTPLPDTLSVDMFEESLRVRLEAFALDAQDALGYSIQTDTETLKERLELQMSQLSHLINEVNLLHWLKLAN